MKVDKRRTFVLLGPQSSTTYADASFLGACVQLFISPSEVPDEMNEVWLAAAAAARESANRRLTIA